MINPDRPTAQQLVDAAFAYVYTDPYRLVQDAAKEHTIANMGQSLEELVTRAHCSLARPEGIVSSAYSALASDCAMEEVDIDDERLSWVKDARRDVALVQKKGLPLTLANVRHAFEFTGPFEKKGAKKKGAKK